MAPITDTIEEFLLAGKASGWSTATATQYRWHLTRWQTWLESQQITDTAQLTRTHYRAYIADARQHWQPATVRIAALTVRAWHRFTAEEGETMPDLPNGTLRPPPVPVRVQRTITSAELIRLLAACTPPAAGLTPDQATATATRNAAMIAILFDTLLRAAELCSLDMDDVDIDAHSLRVVVKGGGAHITAYSQATSTYLREYLQIRPTLAAPNETALFVAVTGNTPGHRLTPNGLRVIVRNVGHRAGIENVSPHAFRRGGAVAATLAGAPSRWVQAHGRWAKLDMVVRYTQALDSNAQIDRWSPLQHAQHPDS